MIPVLFIVFLNGDIFVCRNGFSGLRYLNGLFGQGMIGHFTTDANVSHLVLSIYTIGFGVSNFNEK